jgi:transposase InsO family protein
MRKDIEKQIKNCHRYQVNKSYRQVTSAPLQLMPIPESPLESISLGFVTKLPKRKGFDSIFAVVCYVSKMAHFLPTQTLADAVKLHGLPNIIISDRDPKFTSKFWKSLFKTLETEQRFSTGFHPETRGQTERLNRTPQIMLRHYGEDHLNTWTQFSSLPTTLQHTLLLESSHSH